MVSAAISDFLEIKFCLNEKYESALTIVRLLEKLTSADLSVDLSQMTKYKSIGHLKVI